MKYSKLSISVVIATYNGAEYLLEQINSIIKQLSENDEVIIIDDCSIDATLNIITSYNDKRIKLFVNENNMGVKKSFEKGISLTKNDIIFLSDQDDIWRDDKVDIIISTFIKEKDICLVSSDAIIIDQKGNKINDSFMKSIGGFRHSLIKCFIKNTYLGCTLAFRRELLNAILPLSNKLPMHDSWIGLLAQLIGRVHYIDLPLIKYRRHLSNVSPTNRQSFKQIFIWRYFLLQELIIRYIKIKVNQ